MGCPLAINVQCLDQNIQNVVKRKGGAYVSAVVNKESVHGINHCFRQENRPCAEYNQRLNRFAYSPKVSRLKIVIVGSYFKTERGEGISSSPDTKLCF